MSSAADGTTVRPSPDRPSARSRTRSSASAVDSRLPGRAGRARPRGERDVRLGDRRPAASDRGVDGRAGRTPSQRYGGGVAVSPDGRLMAVTLTDGRIQLWDIADPGPPVAGGRRAVDRSRPTSCSRSRSVPAAGGSPPPRTTRPCGCGTSPIRPRRCSKRRSRTSVGRPIRSRSAPATWPAGRGDRHRAGQGVDAGRPDETAGAQHHRRRSELLLRGDDRARRADPGGGGGRPWRCAAGTSAIRRIRWKSVLRSPDPATTCTGWTTAPTAASSPRPAPTGTCGSGTRAIRPIQCRMRRSVPPAARCSSPRSTRPAP